MPLTRITTTSVAFAAGVLLAGCSGGELASPEPPEPSGPTVSQQSAALAIPLAEVYAALNDFAYDHDGALPVLLVEGSDVVINGETISLRATGVVVEAYGGFEDFCVQTSGAGTGVAEGTTVYASMRGPFGAAETSEMPCAPDYEGPLQFPQTVQPGHYRPLELPMATGICFDQVKHRFGEAGTAEDAWLVKDCQDRHRFEVYGMGLVEDSWFSLSEDDQWDVIFEECGDDLDGYSSPRGGRVVGDHVWGPAPADQFGEPFYYCVGVHRS